MPKLTKESRAKYRMLVRDGASDLECYYCGEAGGMEDLTPSPSAPPMWADAFPDEWTRTNTCNKCWRKIYTANVANAGARFNAQKGCMTVAQKAALIGGRNAKQSIDDSINRFTIGFDPKIVAPVGLLQSGPDTFMYGATTLQREEVMLLQGALALRMIGAPQNLVEQSFALSMSSDDAVMEHIDLYRIMLELPEL